MMIQVEQQQKILIEEIAYGDILAKAGISYQEHDQWLKAGIFPAESKWTIYLSVRVLDGASLLKKVAPILKSLTIPFKVLKHNYALNKANGYGFGLDNVGKFLEAAVPTDVDTGKLIDMLQPVSEQFGGPEVLGAIRVGKIIYASSAQPIEKNNIPFHIPQQYQEKKRKRIMGKYYVPVQLLRSLPKGDTTKAINLRRFKFAWCLIKQGKSHASDDFFGRDMITRLKWQYHVLSDLAGLKEVPTVIDLFMDEHSAYLVLEYIEGITLQQKVQQLSQGKCWKELDGSVKALVLSYFLKVVDLVVLIHDQGFVHRDVTDENFIVTPKGELRLIDFELSWSMKTHAPNPPFGLGTFGYMSPQQHQFRTPAPSDDAYSIGAILIFLLTGSHPMSFLEDAQNSLFAKLEEQTLNAELSSLAVKCLDNSSNMRPQLSEIKTVIIGQLDELLNPETPHSQNTRS